MTEQEAKRRLIAIDPDFENKSEIITEVAIAAFSCGYEHGHSEGYESGFQVGCASERGINAMQARFDQVDAVGEPLVQTYEILKP